LRFLNPTILTLGFAAAGGMPQDAGNPAARLRAAQAIADRVTVETASPGAHQRLERVPEPIYRFDDPARRFTDGSIWAWGRSGRPAALLTMAKERAPAGGFWWLGELTSLAPGPLAATAPRGEWTPPSAGFVMRKLPNAPAPGKDSVQRLRQMKDLVRQIKAYEYFAPDNQPTAERYELRLLPQQVHRYADPSSGLIDGGLFIISYGLNPELVLMVEARREGTALPAWTFGLARISIAEAHVEFAGKEIWSDREAMRGPRDPYWIFTIPIEGDR
jgi:hypothetical protein